MMRDIKEAKLSKVDVKDLFSTLSDSRSGGMMNRIPGLRKGKINVNDLQQAWANHEPNPYPDDTEDIREILLDQGFSEKEISKAFKSVFGAGGEEDIDPGTETVSKIAEYIINAGLKDEILTFLSTKYKMSESYFYGKKMVIEDVRKVFTFMATMPRDNRNNLIREEDKKHLGRTKK